jgi:hypothetical protein
MNKWNKVTDDTIFPHSSLDSSTDTMLLWLKKDYAPSVYLGHYDYENGGFWSVQGIDHLARSNWEVTHWMHLPVGPEDIRRSKGEI